MHITAYLMPVFASANGLLQITICSADSIRTITIDENGNQLPEKPTMRMQKCSFCAATGFTALPAEQTHIEPLKIKAPTLTAGNQTTHFQTIRKNAHQTRAPPHLS